MLRLIDSTRHALQAIQANSKYMYLSGKVVIFRLHVRTCTCKKTRKTFSINMHSRKGWKRCVAHFSPGGRRATTCGTRRATTCHEAFVPRRATTCHDVPRRATTCGTSRRRRPLGEVSLLALREAATHARASPKSTSLNSKRELVTEKICYRRLCEEVKPSGGCSKVQRSGPPLDI